MKLGNLKHLKIHRVHSVCTVSQRNPAKMNKTDHAERTADQPRDHVRISFVMRWHNLFADDTHDNFAQSLNNVILKQIDEVGRSVRLFRLEIPRTVGSIKVRWAQKSSTKHVAREISGGTA